jgi:hypothetical protein
MKQSHAKVVATGVGVFCLGTVVGGMTALGLPFVGVAVFGALFTPLSYEAAVTFYSIHKPQDPDNVQEHQS